MKGRLPPKGNSFGNSSTILCRQPQFDGVDFATIVRSSANRSLSNILLVHLAYLGRRKGGDHRIKDRHKRSALYDDERALFLFRLKLELTAQSLAILSGAFPLPANQNQNIQDGRPIPKCLQAMPQEFAKAFSGPAYL